MKTISKKIKDVFDFHEYKIEPENLKRVTLLIYEKEPDISEKDIELFFTNMLQGKYGILFKQPTCITSMYQKFLNEKPITADVPLTARRHSR